MLHFLLLIIYLLCGVPVPASAHDQGSGNSSTERKREQAEERAERAKRRALRREGAGHLSSAQATEGTSQRTEVRQASSAQVTGKHQQAATAPIDSPQTTKGSSQKAGIRQIGSPQTREKAQDKGKGKQEHGTVWQENGGIVITYFNVGQGNCVLMENKEKNQVVLIDCGSKEKSNTVRSQLDKPEIDSHSIAQTIQSKLSNYRKKYILVTHADEDHYNMIHNIVGPLEGIPFIISIGPDVHSKKKEEATQRLLNSLTQNGHDHISQIRHPEELERVLNDYGLADWVGAIAAGASTSAEPSTNADSIVIKAYLGKCSALMTGDAEKLIHRQIQSRHEASSLSTTVLLASHHGSDTEGSNSEEWLRLASPQALIVSSGHYASYRHPRCSILQRYLGYFSSNNNGISAQPHQVTCGSDFLDFETYRPLDLPDQPRFTGREPIFNTFDQGNISVSFSMLDSGKNQFTLISAAQGLLLKEECK